MIHSSITNSYYRNVQFNDHSFLIPRKNTQKDLNNDVESIDSSDGSSEGLLGLESIESVSSVERVEKIKDRELSGSKHQPVVIKGSSSESSNCSEESIEIEESIATPGNGNRFPDENETQSPIFIAPKLGSRTQLKLNYRLYNNSSRANRYNPYQMKPLTSPPIQASLLSPEL